MNRRTFFAAALLAGSTLLSGEASAQAQQNFQLINSSGYTINEIYVSATNQRNWGRDLLGDGTLVTGRAFNVRFSPSTQACNWDLRIVYADRDQSELRGVNLCQVSRITVFWDHGRNQSRFVTE